MPGGGGERRPARVPETGEGASRHGPLAFRSPSGAPSRINRPFLLIIVPSKDEQEWKRYATLADGM